MSIASDAVGLFRDQWSSRFVDAGTLNRETNQGTLNTTTGQYESASSSQVYTGACLIRPANRTEADFGERNAEVEMYSIYVPHTAAGAQPGDSFTVSSSVYDSDLVGAVLVVREIVEDSYLTKYEWVAERIK